MQFLLARFAFLVFAALPFLDARAQTLYFVTEDLPPFNYQEGGIAAGPMAAIVQSVCGQMKVTCKIDLLPWRRSILLAEQGKADAVFSIRNSPERAKIFYFSTPVVETAYALYARDSSKFVFHDNQDLKGHTIGVYGPSGTSITLDEQLKSVHGTKTVTEIDNISVLRLLSTGGYGDDGLVFINRDVADFMIQKTGIKNLRKVIDVKKMQYCIAFSKTSITERLFRRFDDTLNLQMRDGTVKAILDKYKLKQAD